MADQSPERGARDDDVGLASSYNMAIVQAVSKSGGRKTSTIDLMSERRPSMNYMVKYIGSVLDE